MNPAFLSARTTRLPSTAGSFPPAILRGDGYAADFGISIGRNGHSLIRSVCKNGADGFLRVGDGFLLGIPFGDDFRKCWDKDGKAATFLWLQDDREAVMLRHYVAPAFHV